MIHGPMAGKILLFALPLMLSGLLQLAFNAADVIVVGRFAGSEALAAVSSSSNLIQLMIGFFNGLAMGAGVVIARSFGAKDYGKMDKAIHTAIAFGLVSGIS